MKLIDSTPHFGQLTVTMHDGDEIISEHIFDVTNISAHVLRKNFPRGVTPIAITARASITTPTGKIENIMSCGIGLTKEDARKEAKHNLRKKLCETAKKRKFLITLSGNGYTVRSPKIGRETIYGYGYTLEEACSNFKDNLKAIEKLLTDPKPTDFQTVDVVMNKTSKSKYWWQFWK